MGCFSGCFGSSKDQKHRKQTYKVTPRDQNLGSCKPLETTVFVEQGNTEEPRVSVSDLRYTDKSDEQLSLSTRKRVTFDSNVKTYEHVVYESTDSLPDTANICEEEKKESFPNSISEDDSITSSVVSYPPNHRYQNCQESDDEIDESECEDNKDDDDDEEHDEDYDYDDEVSDARIVCKEVWSEAIPTESVKSAQLKSMEEMKSIGSNRNVRDRSVYVHPVLNPVENVTQWKAVKSKGTTTHVNQQKENLNSDQEVPRISYSPEPNFKQTHSHQAKNPSQEIAVDASLSNWLASREPTNKKKPGSFGFTPVISEKTESQGSLSPKSFEDRPILGALTVEEIQQFSANSSPRKSANRSPDDMPIIGSVGSYWNDKEDSSSVSSYKGIPNTTSKYREDKKVNWHSTPFETRLEKALRRDSAAETE